MTSDEAQRLARIEELLRELLGVLAVMNARLDAMSLLRRAIPEALRLELARLIEQMKDP